MRDKIIALFFNETLRRWHFEAIVKESKLSRERVNHFLKELVKDHLVIRTKLRGKMPYYVANRENTKFRFEKRLYGLNLLRKAGLFEHLASLQGVKTAILFGSFSRGDYSKSSDIDLFIYGNGENFDKGKFESKLKREIQLFNYQDKRIKELDAKLIPNIVKGFNIKGNLEPFEVSLNV